MKRVVLLIASILLVCSSLLAREETARFGRFGAVSLYYLTPKPAHIALFVSGDGGWNQGVVDMARELATLDALIVGIDVRHYLAELARSTDPCFYPAADFEALSKFVQKKLDYPAYLTPLLVGYSSGATLVYATLVQAPPNTFKGAISLGFCPDLLLSKPLCRGDGLEWQRGPKGKGYIFLPANTLEVPWVALQGTVDQVCDPKGTEEYVKKVRNGEIVILPKVGHGFSVPRNWMPQFRQAFARLVGEEKKPAAVSADTLSDLPLIEVPATVAQTRSMAVIVTGDGGWGVTDRGIAESLAAHGIPAVGWNSLQYYWHAKTPEKAAQDLDRLLAHYLSAWGKESVVLIGYSLGADVLPFMLNRLPQEMREKVRVVALLGLGSMVDFEFHLTDWLGTFTRATSRPVKPEVERLRGMKIYCFYGADDSDALCKDLDPGLVKSVVLEVGHRIGRQYQPVVYAILKEVQ